MRRECCMAGCTKPELCGVGPMNEPMCQEHYDGWLAGQRRTLSTLMDLLTPRSAQKSQAPR